MGEHESYYTEEVSRAVAAIDNTKGVALSIYLHSDEDGPYLIVAFSFEEYTRKLEKFGEPVARYIVDVMKTLTDHGLRATMLVAE